MKKLLLGLSALGLATSVLTTANIFAASTDSAKLEGLAIHTGELPKNPPPPGKSVDLQLASYDGQECGEFTEDLVVSVDMDLAFPGIHEIFTMKKFCIRNVGNSTAAVSITEFVDESVETDCTGDEATVDATCGGGLEGELDENTMRFVSETEFAPAGTTSVTLNAGETKVLYASAGWHAYGDIVASQSDRLLYHYVFDGSLA